MMRLAGMVVLLAVVAAVWEVPAAQAQPAEPCATTRGRRCSTPPGGQGKALSEQALTAARLEPGERIVVPVVYHLVYGSYPAPGKGDEPDDLAHAPPLALTKRQTQALNRAFRGTGISFRTEQATFRDFAPWSNEGPPSARPTTRELTAMVRDLTASREEALHVFLLREAQNRAAAPDTKSMFEEAPAADGILMNWDYLPYVKALRPIGNPVVRRFYFQGEMLVHLVGHYLGLLHTFEEWSGPGEGGSDGKAQVICGTACSQTSDQVRDTPAHRWIWADLGRCVPLDTCKDSPGMDPMTNYMNLEPDLCASELTPGQVERMERMVRLFRPYLVVPAGGDDS